MSSGTNFSYFPMDRSCLARFLSASATDRHPISIDFFAKPSTAPDLLKQLSSQGAKGFRLKTYLFNDTTTLLVSVRDTSRPSAKYSYRYGQCVSSLDALFAQINTNAAQGYRLYGPLRLENSCQIFIKDKSRKSTFVYEMVPNPDTLKNFLAEANQLGARGYRHAGDTLADLSSSGTDFYSTFPLYYRDKTQKGLYLLLFIGSATWFDQQGPRSISRTSGERFHLFSRVSANLQLNLRSSWTWLIVAMDTRISKTLTNAFALSFPLSFSPSLIKQQ